MIKRIFLPISAVALAALGTLAIAGGQLSPKAQSELTQAMSHIQNIGASVMLYASDYDDRLPLASSTAQAIKLTQPYLKDDSFWNHPVRGEVLYNTALSGVSLARIKNTSKTLLLWEKKSTEGFRVAAFADAHAAKHTEAEWKKVWSAELQRRKVK